MASRKQAFIDTYRQEMALTNAQELMNASLLSVPSSPLLTASQKCNEKCFAKCVAKPGSSLSGSEQVRRASRSPMPFLHTPT